MTEKERWLVSRIKASAGTITSFVAEYDLQMSHAGVRLESKGTIYYSGHSRFRVEGVTNGQRIITVSVDDHSQTYFVDQKVLSQRNSLPDQSPIDVLHGLSDIRDVFGSTDQDSLQYVGPDILGGNPVHQFKGYFPVLSIPGNVRVRMPIDVQLFVDRESCLLLERVWSTRRGTRLVDSRYSVVRTNSELADDLFVLEPTDPDVRLIDTMDVSKVFFFADETDQGASMN